MWHWHATKLEWEKAADGYLITVLGRQPKMTINCALQGKEST